MDTKILNPDFSHSNSIENPTTTQTIHQTSEEVTIEGERLREYMLDIAESVREGGYDPISQIMGFILSDEPTHIANHNGARAKIGKVDRYELLEDIVRFYINS